LRTRQLTATDPPTSYVEPVKIPDQGTVPKRDTPRASGREEPARRGLVATTQAAMKPDWSTAEG